MDSQGISSKFLYHEIQDHLLNQITYLKYEKYPQEKILLLEIQPIYDSRFSISSYLKWCSVAEFWVFLRIEFGNIITR